jgi:hypothetical protein
MTDLELKRLPEFEDPRSLDEAKIFIHNLGKNMAEHAYKIGKILMWVKGQLKHGEFLKWIEENVWFTARTAQRFLRFTEKCEEKGRLIDESHYLESPKSDNLSHLEEFNFLEFLSRGIYKISNGKCGVSENGLGLVFADDISFEEWQNVGKFLKQFALPSEDTPIKDGGYLRFFIGDWLVWGELKQKTAVEFLRKWKELVPKIEEEFKKGRKEFRVTEKGLEVR